MNVVLRKDVSAIQAVTILLRSLVNSGVQAAKKVQNLLLNPMIAGLINSLRLERRNDLAMMLRRVRTRKFQIQPSLCNAEGTTDVSMTLGVHQYPERRVFERCSKDVVVAFGWIRRSCSSLLVICYVTILQVGQGESLSFSRQRRGRMTCLGRKGSIREMRSNVRNAPTWIGEF